MTDYTTTRTIEDTNPTGFNGSFNSKNFHNECLDEVGFSITFTHINVDYTNDTNTTGLVTLGFNGSQDLIAGDETLIDTLVSNHNAIQIPGYNVLTNLNLYNPTIENTTYTREGMLVYPGSNSTKPLSKIYATGYKDSETTSFSIEIFDSTNGTQIVESVFTNNSESILDLGTLTNIPTNNSLLEINIKKTGGNINNNAYVNNVTFYQSK